MIMTYRQTLQVHIPVSSSILKNQARSSVGLTFREPKPSSGSLRMTGGGWSEVSPAILVLAGVGESVTVPVAVPSMSGAKELVVVPAAHIVLLTLCLGSRTGS